MTDTSAPMLPVPPSHSATPTRRTGRLRRPLGVAVLVAAGALLAGCGSDDGDSTGAGDTTVASDTTMAMDTTGATAEAGDLTITTARIGEPAGPTAGLFLSVENAGDQPDSLVAVATDVSPEVQLHETVTDGDTTSMNQLSGGIEIPAGESVDLEPGGLHAMLMEVDELVADQHVPVTLTFETEGDVEIVVPVVPLTELGGGMEMDHDDTDAEAGGDMDADMDMDTETSEADG